MEFYWISLMLCLTSIMITLVEIIHVVFLKKKAIKRIVPVSLSLCIIGITCMIYQYDSMIVWNDMKGLIDSTSFMKITAQFFMFTSPALNLILYDYTKKNER